MSTEAEHEEYLRYQHEKHEHELQEAVGVLEHHGINPDMPEDAIFAVASRLHRLDTAVGAARDYRKATRGMGAVSPASPEYHARALRKWESLEALDTALAALDQEVRRG